MSKTYLLATVAMLSLAVAGAGHTEAAATSGASAGSTIEELVVTAEKRAQNLEDVPVAISAFTSEKRDLLGILTIQDLTNFTPGLNFSSANDRSAVRGIGRLSNQHPVAVPVAVYDDGIYTTSTATAGKSPILTDRIEVLRGPQGTLYGRNSIGGAINVISTHPTEDPYGEVRLTVGNYGRTLLEAATSGPLAPNLQFRLAGDWEKQTQGYFTNVVPGMPSEGGVVDQYYLEGQLQAKFGDRLDGWGKFSMSGANNGSGGAGGRTTYTTGPIDFSEFSGQNLRSGFACAPGGVVTNVVNASPLGCVNPANQDPRKFASLVAQTTSLDNAFGGAINLSYHLDGADVRYVGGGTNYHYTQFSDNGGGSVSAFTIPTRPASAGAPAATCSAALQAAGRCTLLTVFPEQTSTYSEDYHNFSNDLSIASTSPGALQWIGGVFYYREGYHQPVFTTLPNQPALDGPVNSAAGAAALDFQRRLYDDRPAFQEESYAVYGQLDWKFTSTFKATLGLRWSHDHLYGSEAARVLCFATTPCGTTPELLGSLVPPVDVTNSLVYTGGPSHNITPTGVVAGPNGGVTFTPDGFAHRAYDASWSAPTGTAGLQWDPEPGAMAYVRYSRGYLMGGFASGVTSTLGQFPYTDAEYDNDYELGVKKSFGRRLQVNLDLFYEDIRGYQAPLSVVANTGALAVSQSQLLNIPKAVSTGVELETIWAPIDHLQVIFNYSYDDAYISTLTGIIDPTDPEATAAAAKPLTALTACATAATPLCDVNTGLVQRPQNLKGNELPQAPRNKVALNVTYAAEFAGGTLTPSASYVWRDKQYATLFTRAYNAAPSWDQVDLRVTWKARSNHYSLIAYVNNVFDTLGYDGGASSSRISGVYAASTIAAAGLTRGLAGAIPGTFNAVEGISSTYPLTPPRTFGVELEYRF